LARERKECEMKSFKHLNAKNISGCISLLQGHQGRSKVIAGGTDLLGILKGKILPESPELLINIKEIPNLDGIREENGILKIGALTRISGIAESLLVKERYNALAQSAKAVATPVIRDMATLGGNLCQDVRCWFYRYPHEVGGRILCLRKGGKQCPAVAGDNRYHAIMGGKKCFAAFPSDMAIALTALDAEICIMGPKGERFVPIRDFYTSLGNILDPDEIVTGIHAPGLPGNSRQAFVKFTLRKPIDFAVVSVASVISLQNNICAHVRISLGAVAPFPMRAMAAEKILINNPLNEETIRAAAEATVIEARPLSMNAYKVELTKALTRRALYILMQEFMTGCPQSCPTSS
jgi:xanthine dehydrogenase YagS FAD-binding subunit